MSEKWTSVESLVGSNIMGLRAIVTQPEHFEMYQRNNEKPKVRTLLRAERVKKEDGVWLYLRWTPESGDFSCEYSGWREDYKGTPVVLFSETR